MLFFAKKPNKDRVPSFILTFSSIFINELSSSIPSNENSKFYFAKIARPLIRFSLTKVL